MSKFNGSSDLSSAAAIRASIPERKSRAPRHVTFEEIEQMPRMEFVPGMESGIFVSRERDESQYFSQGLCFHAADMDDLVWEQTGWEEAFMCLKGKLHVRVEDADGQKNDYFIEEGGHFWAPQGYKYILRATGIDSINFWTMGRS